MNLDKYERYLIKNTTLIESSNFNYSKEFPDYRFSDVFFRNFLVDCIPSDGMPIACPRTGVVAGATEEHLIGNLCDVAVVKDIRRGTLNEIGRRCVLAAQLVKDLQVKARSGGEPGAPKGEVDGRHMGHTKSDLLKEFAEAKAAAGRGFFLPDGYQFGLQLTTKGSNFRGVDLGTKIKKSRRRR